MSARLRHQVSVNKVKYDLSDGQFVLLMKSTIKFLFPTDFNDQRRVDGLLAKGLIVRSASTSRSVTYKRTDLGKQVFVALTSRPLAKKKVTKK